MLDRKANTQQTLDTHQTFEWLGSLVKQQNICLECGAGPAEPSQFMARRFRCAIALDHTPKYLSHVTADIGRICADASTLPFKDECVDLVFSVQSLHHFNVERHLEDARRVLAPGGVFAAFGWGEVELPSDIAKAFAPTFQALSPYWEAERAWVVDGYQGLAFRGDTIKMPKTYMIRMLTLEQFELVVARWSATQTAFQRGADIPDPDLTRKQQRSKAPIEVRWPLVGQVFRI